jgi:hypothetical protein
VIPLRAIVALDEGAAAAARRALEGAGHEVFAARTATQGLILLSRVHPDLLLLDPSCGGGRAEDWRRALARFRRSRALGLLVVAPSASIRALFSSEADLGVHEQIPPSRRLLALVAQWAGEDEEMRRAG